LLEGFFYLKLNAHVKNDTGSFACNKRLFITRGMNQKINNPDIWNNPEWVKSLGERAE
jgi:hypothetical protein